jgi:hypothetical protein
MEKPTLKRATHFTWRRENMIARLLYCSSEAATTEDKANSKAGEIVLVSIASWPPTRALVIKALLVKDAS